MQAQQNSVNNDMLRTTSQERYARAKRWKFRLSSINQISRPKNDSQHHKSSRVGRWRANRKTANINAKRREAIQHTQKGWKHCQYSTRKKAGIRSTAHAKTLSLEFEAQHTQAHANREESNNTAHGNGVFECTWKDAGHCMPFYLSSDDEFSE
jgi:hypothetical protein